MSSSCPTIDTIERSYNRRDLPLFRAGDTVKVHALISEGNKERIQIFEGVCIHRKGQGARGSFTVRKVSHGVGVERVFPINSPRVTKVELVTRGRVRRGKLYYLRGLRGNAARIKAKLGDISHLLAPVDEPEEFEPETAVPLDEHGKPIEPKAEGEAAEGEAAEGAAAEGETKE